MADRKGVRSVIVFVREDALVTVTRGVRVSAGFKLRRSQKVLGLTLKNFSKVFAKVFERVPRLDKGD